MRSKIKILETIRQGSIGGGETYLMNLALHLDASRFEPIVLAFTDGEMISRLRSAGIQCHVIPTETPFDVRVYPRVMKLIDDLQPHIVHFHGSRAGTNTLIPARLKRKPLVYTVHGWSFHTGTSSTVQRGRIAAEKLLVRFSDMTVCGSEADIANGRQLIKNGNFTLIHNSIDTGLYQPREKNIQVRNEFGIGADDFTVCFLARITFQKDPLTFLRAARIVLHHEPSIRFLMIGDGDMKTEVLEEARRLDIYEKIVFSPFRVDVPEVLSAIDVFVLPSLWEVIPLALLEAMAMEKICIATDIPGTTEALANGTNGMLFRQGSAEELAECILKTRREPDMAERLRRKARETAVSRFDIRTLVEKNETLYAKIAGGGIS